MTKYVHDFLRSDVQSKTFGHFEGIQHARFFGRKYFPNGNYNKNGYYSYDEDGNRKSERLIPINILKLPRSRFTPNGFNTLLFRLFDSQMAYTSILFQSPYINSNAEQRYIQQYHLTVKCLPMDHNFFIKVFEDFPSVDF